MKQFFIFLFFIPFALFAKVHYENENIMDEINENICITNKKIDLLNEQLSRLNRNIIKVLDSLTPIYFDIHGNKVESKKED